MARSPGKCANDSFRFVVDNGQQDSGCPIRNATTLFPILQRVRVQTESLCEFFVAYLHAVAKGENPLRRRVIDDSAGKIDFSTPTCQYRVRQLPLRD